MSWLTRACALLLLALVMGGLLAPWLAPHDPFEVDLTQRLAPPSWDSPLGRDAHGADILSRLLWGARISLGVAFLVVGLAATVGTLIGLVSGYFGGLIDTLLMRLVDILLAFPGLLLAISLVAVLGPSLTNLVLALAALGWVSFARLARGQVLTIKERTYVTAARAAGATHATILGRHVLPNVLSPVIVQATFGIASVVLAESSLSFLGLGVPPGTPTWGAMLAEGREVLFESPRVSMLPGLAIFLTVLSANLLGDVARDRYDPKAEGP